MNLFDSIGLSADPFSTSPNVDLFYPAVEHRQCLEGLELAIRMRRGLSVIRGGIGVGKTTISRKLIQNFKEESDDFDFYLILDPKFESEIILLKHIIELFGVNDTAESVQDCRNIIENHLLKVGVEQGKTLVLIIDEGQNLPGEMLDVFRTLLNFETDDFKLLQLIIFGQPEMGTMIHKYPNFEDRISFDFEIGPISLEDMRGMIDHRLEVTGGDPGSWFIEKALIKIHKNTQGYPRKVTQLCHQLLLTMISEEKDEINEEMVQRVISGKIDTGGLLKQKKKNYNEIAVNKLLDVLRKDEPEDKEDVTEPEQDQIDDDDWIGGDEPPIIEPPIEEIKVVEEPIESPPIPKQKTIEQDNNKIDAINEKPIEKEKEIEDAPTPAKVSKDDFLPTQGRYPPHVKASLLGHIPIDQTYTGIHIDRGRIITTVIHENNGLKTLLAYDIHSANDKDLDPSDNPEEFLDACRKTMDRLDESMSDYGDIYRSASRSVGNRNTITLTVDHNHMLFKLVNVPKENKKDKGQIIEWAVKKDLQFPIEDSIIDHVGGRADLYHVGVGEKSALEAVSAQLKQLEWDIRKWYPTAQAIHNAFLWNYPEHRKKNTLIIHIGEKNSLIIGCSRAEIKIVNPLFIGAQSLTESLSDNGLSVKDWGDRKMFQVPETFLRAMGQKVGQGEHDDIFRPVFDAWRQEIDRTLNGIRKEYKISEETEILLSGTAGEIIYLDKFIEGSTGLSTQYLNPLRNLSLANEFDKDFSDIHPAVLTASIGSALNLDRSVNIMPKHLKQEEILRWVNRSGLMMSAAALLFFFALSISTQLSISSLRAEIGPIQEENDQLSYVENKHDELKSNKVNVQQQLDVLSSDIEYFNHILAINRFLSYYTPKEILIEEVNFQQGWNEEGYKKVGRDLIKVVTKLDDHMRIVRIAGNVNANSILLDSHLNSFTTALEESGLFQNIEIMSEASKIGLGKNNLQFILKCII